MKTAMSTLCYIQQEVRGRESYLMLHRVTKKNDINHDKWIGVGGHFEKERVRRNAFSGRPGRKRGTPCGSTDSGGW